MDIDLIRDIDCEGSWRSIGLMFSIIWELVFEWTAIQFPAEPRTIITARRLPISDSLGWLGVPVGPGDHGKRRFQRRSSALGHFQLGRRCVETSDDVIERLFRLSRSLASRKKFELILPDLPRAPAARRSLIWLRCTRICARMSPFFLALRQTEEICKFARFTQANSTTFDKQSKASKLQKPQF